MSAPTASLTVRKVVPCSPEEAFRAWTEPALLQQWFSTEPGKTAEAQIDLRLGGRYRIGVQCHGGEAKSYVGGEFVVIDPPRRLEYTWTWEKESRPEWTDRSVVKIAFNRLGKERTEVVLTHELITDPEQRADHAKGWTLILDRMAEVLTIQPSPSTRS